jgi:hypothetical protein
VPSSEIFVRVLPPLDCDDPFDPYGPCIRDDPDSPLYPASRVDVHCHDKGDTDDREQEEEEVHDKLVQVLQVVVEKKGGEWG